VYDRVFVLASSTAPPEPPPGAIRRAPVVLYPQAPNQNPRQIPVFRPRFPVRPAARGEQDNGSDDNGNDDAAKAPAASPVITAPVGTSQPGLVIVPQKKKPDGGGR
jgi:hypothetical protein